MHRRSGHAENLWAIFIGWDVMIELLHDQVVRMSLGCVMTFIKDDQIDLCRKKSINMSHVKRREGDVVKVTLSI